MELRHIHSRDFTERESRLLWDAAPASEKPENTPVAPTERKKMEIKDVKDVAAATEYLKTQALQDVGAAIGKISKAKVEAPSLIASFLRQLGGGTNAEGGMSAKKEKGAEPAGPGTTVETKPAAAAETKVEAKPKGAPVDGAEKKEGEQKNPSEAEPKTEREAIRREMDIASATLSGKNKDGTKIEPPPTAIDKLIAAVSLFASLQRLFEATKAGTLDKPLEKKAELPADKAKEEPGSGKNGEKEPVGEKNPESEKKRAEKSQERRPRLTEEAKEKPGGFPELKEEKQKGIDASKEEIKKIDDRINDNEKRTEKLDDANDDFRKQIRDLEQARVDADDAGKKKIDDQIRDLNEEISMNDKEIKTLEENRKTLLDRKERKQPVAQEKDVKEIDAMDSEARENFKQFELALQSMADGLKDINNPNAKAFVEMVGGLNPQYNAETQNLTKLEGEQAAKVVDLAKDMGVTLENKWDSDVAALCKTLKGIVEAIHKEERAKQEPKKEGSQKDEKPKGDEGEPKPGEQPDEGGAERTKESIRKDITSQINALKADAAVNQFNDESAESEEIVTKINALTAEYIKNFSGDADVTQSVTNEVGTLKTIKGDDMGLYYNPSRSIYFFREVDKAGEQPKAEKPKPQPEEPKPAEPQPKPETPKPEPQPEPQPEEPGANETDTEAREKALTAARSETENAIASADLTPHADLGKEMLAQQHVIDVATKELSLINEGEHDNVRASELDGIIKQYTQEKENVLKKQLTEWATNIQSKANDAVPPYNVDVTVTEDNRLNFESRDVGVNDDGSYPMIENVAKYAAARGMTFERNSDSSITVNVVHKDERGRGYFGTKEEQAIQELVNRMGNADGADALGADTQTPDASKNAGRVELPASTALDGANADPKV